MFETSVCFKSIFKLLQKSWRNPYTLLNSSIYINFFEEHKNVHILEIKALIGQ